jgi:hypothetical protein
LTPGGADLEDPTWLALDPWRGRLAELDNELAPDLSNVVELARPLPLVVWGAALLRPAEVFPRASAYLPRMPPASVQREWVGDAGASLLDRSVGALRQVNLWLLANGIDPAQSKGMDFGVGWGRLARLWLKFAPPEGLVGADAWNLSLQHARDCGIRNSLILSDANLDPPPLSDGELDFAWAFSVFTHLSEAAFRACLAGLTRMLRVDGALVFTVRPHQYWAYADAEIPPPTTPIHHVPDPRGGGYYGDTTVGMAWLEDVCREAGLAAPRYEWSTNEPYQVLVLTTRAR